MDSVVDARKKATKVDASQVLDNGGQGIRSELEGLLRQERQTEHINSTNSFNTISSPVRTAGPSFVNDALPSPIDAPGTPAKKWAIGTKWVFRNKKNERGIVIKNKARLVAQGHTQEEVIDYDEVFALVARIEAIRLFLAYVSFKDFVVYQMGVKSAFLYGKIEEEVYVYQPPGFEDPDFPNKVYKKELSMEFETLMHDKFQMSSMEELSFFLGLQVQQKSDEIFISQDKYVTDILKKISFSTIKTVSTPMEPNKELVKDAKAKDAYLISKSGSQFRMMITKDGRCFMDIFVVKTGISSLNTAGQRTQSMATLNEPLQGTGSVEGIAKHKEIYVMYSHTKKIFANMKRQEQGFSRNVTPLFETMMVIAQEEVGECLEVSTADQVTTAGEVVTAASVKDSVVPTTATTADVHDELTLSKTLITIKAAKPKVISTAITTPRAKGIVFYEQVQALQPIVSLSKDKGKAKMIEPKKPLKKKDQIALDKEVARKLEVEIRAKLEEEERITREKDEASRDVIEEWDDVQATIDADRQLAEQIQAQEREQILSFCLQESEYLCGYGYIECGGNLKKTKAEGSSKRVGQELEQESVKKQKLAEQEQDKVANDDTAELKRCLKIVPEHDDDVAIEATPISFKSPTIVDYKIYREGKKSYFKIIRAEGNSQNYLTYGIMFKNFNREDLAVLRSIVKERFKKTKPVNDMENLLFQTLKTMFEPHVEDIIWKYQQRVVKVNN
uniref:Copia protein n=1 Tax=Tanacetum cinerariifolium TaxID=118510 RepID=A0A6L2JG27_TANCI|nr:copia protein [Tanacetum cinerariifolium]